MAFYSPVPMHYSDSSASSSPSPQTQLLVDPSYFCQNQQLYQQPNYPLPIHSQFTSSDPTLARRPRNRSARHVASSPQIQIAHPYARLLAKKDEVKRRKIWNHALEKFIFSPYEMWVHHLLAPN